MTLLEMEFNDELLTLIIAFGFIALGIIFTKGYIIVIGCLIFVYGFYKFVRKVNADDYENKGESL